MARKVAISYIFAIDNSVNGYVTKNSDLLSDLLAYSDTLENKFILKLLFLFLMCLIFIETYIIWKNPAFAVKYLFFFLKNVIAIIRPNKYISAQISEALSTVNI